MKLDSGTSVSQPGIIPRAKVSVDLPALFLGILEAIPSIVLTAQTPADAASGVVSGIASSLGAVSFETPLEDRAWRLMYRSSGTAFAELASEMGGQLADKERIRPLISELKDSLNSLDVVINDEFFRNPLSVAALQPIMRLVRRLGIDSGLSDMESEVFAARFPPYFVAAVHNEWVRAAKDYEPLLEAVQSPFTKQTRSMRERVRYSAWLKKQIHLPVFEEKFSLRDVYIPLRGFFEEERLRQSQTADEYGTQSRQISQISDMSEKDGDATKRQKTVVDVTSDFTNWILKGDKSDAIRILSGGPGSGKSSILKVIAASIADLEHLYPIYVPLQRISLTDDLCKSVLRYLRESGLYSSDIFEDARSTGGRIVLFLDGLDELAKPGAVAETIAQDFLLELQRTVTVSNTVQATMTAVVSGRTIAVQKTKNVLRLSSSQQFSVMRYAYEPDEQEYYNDPDKLLEPDQRLEWWDKYSKAKGFSSAIPGRLVEADVSELSTEPLLNYLLVLSGYHLKPREEGGLNRNDVYKSLLTGVHRRGYEDGRYQPTQALTDEDFELVMETIAVAAWYGDSRTASVEDIRKRCTTPKLKEIFDRFVAGGGGVTRLIAAFYFQAANKEASSRSDEAFEFTHKSFGEYLTARRIVRALDRIAKELLADQSEKETPFDENVALRSWVALCGAAPVDGDLARFVRDEVRMPQWSGRLEEWHACASRLINRSLSKGFSVGGATPLTSIEAAAICRNSEESLWCIAGACAAALKLSLDINWPEKTSAGAMIHRIRGQRWPDNDNVLLNSFAYVDLSGQNLVIQDLFSSDLRGAMLVSSQLIKTEMQDCDLTGADLRDSSLTATDLSNSSADDAIFDLCQGHRMVMERSSANRSTFRHVHFSQSDLSASEFDECDFSNSSLSFSEIFECSFLGANLQETGWSDVDASGSNFEGADFSNGRFERVVFNNSNFEGARFDGAEFIDCTFVGAFFSDNPEPSGVPNADISRRAVTGTFGNDETRYHARRMSRIRTLRRREE